VKDLSTLFQSAFTPSGCATGSLIFAGAPGLSPHARRKSSMPTAPKRPA
jgi:hypothetical protein